MLLVIWRQKVAAAEPQLTYMSYVHQLRLSCTQQYGFVHRHNAMYLWKDNDMLGATVLC